MTFSGIIFEDARNLVRKTKHRSAALSGTPGSRFLPIPLFHLPILPLLLPVFLSVTFSPAAAQRYNIKTYSEGDGLPSTAVKCIKQDPSGRMWFATRSGVTSYDGFEWKVYGLGDGLPNLDHSSVLVDQTGSVWALSAYAELSMLDGGRWKTLAKLQGAEFTGGNYVMTASVMSGERPMILLMEIHRGVRYFDGGGIRPLPVAGAPDDLAYCGITVVDDRVFLATSKGLFSVSGDSLAAGFEHVPGTPRIPILSISYDELKKVLWLVGKDWIGIIEKGEFTPVLIIDKLDSGLFYGFYASVPDDIGGLYYGNSNYMYRFDGRNTIEPIGRNGGLIDEGVLSLSRDREGNIWVAGLRGISRINGISFAGFSKDNGLFDYEVTAILETRGGGILLGHPSGLTWLDNPIRTMRITDDKQTERILDLVEDGTGVLWAAANEKGLVRIGRDGQRTVFSVRDGLDIQVRSVLIDRRGRLWVMGNARIFVRGNEGFEPVNLPVTGNGRLADLRVLYEASDGTIYAATRGYGVFAIGEGLKPRIFSAGSVTADNVYSVFKSADSTLYAGTYDGLFRVSNGILERSGPPGPVIDRPVYFIIEDHKSRLWFGTDNGVYRWDGKQIAHYSVENGLLGRETNRAGGLVDSKGQVWIGTDRGVSVYREKFDVRRNVPPAVTLVSLETTEATFPLEIPVSLDHKHNSFIVNFRAVIFSEDENPRIRSRLEGYESGWSNPYHSPGRQIRYTNLRPGRYTFHLQAAGQEGPWSEPVSSRTITIHGPFWISLWFRFLAGALVILFAWWVLAFFSQRRYTARLREEVEIKVAEKREMEKELARAGKLKSIGVLAGGIAHDFNNFLAAIVGNLSMLESSDRLSGEDRELAAHALTAANRARSLTSQLLTFSKGGTPVRETGDIRSVIRETATFIMRGSNSNCVFDLPEDLQNIEMDADQISQVINNLLLNARQAMPDGGVIEIRAKNYEYSPPGPGPRLPSPGKYVMIEIEDHGTGIPASIIEHIFDPYFTTRPEGSGLGLTTAYSIVEKHGGRIEIRSEEGRGTTVSFYLPASVKPSPGEIALPAAAVAGGNRARVLVMDDDDTVRNLIVRMLVMLGHSTGVARDGREALDLYSKGVRDGKPWDIVIMDLTIPGEMGGKETIGPLLEMDPRAKAIVSSGYSNDDVLANFARYGFRARLPKPFTKEDLARAIEAVL